MNQYDLAESERKQPSRSGRALVLDGRGSGTREHVLPLTINGTAEQRANVEDWLRQICSQANVDRNTGAVSLGPTPGQYTTGCDCLRRLIEGGPGRRVVTVHLLDAAHQRYPRDHTRPATDRDPPIRDAGGGATVPWDEGAYMDGNGNPGKGPDGQPGSNADVYIDNSDFARHGYDFQAPETNQKIECPQWIILAHELTTGHASWCIQGLELGPESKGMTTETYKAKRENRVIDSEQPHRLAHVPKLKRRPHVPEAD